MKKVELHFLSLLFLIFSITLTSCDKKQTLSVGNGTLQSSSSIDLDLTTMSKTMIYSTVFDMLIMQDQYLGKTIKVKGLFKVFESNDGERYFAILIPDATACCQQGIEFIWPGEHSYPTDYPVQDQEITITGIYKYTEIEEGIGYTYLEISEIEE